MVHSRMVWSRIVMAIVAQDIFKNGLGQDTHLSVKYTGLRP